MTLSLSKSVWEALRRIDEEKTGQFQNIVNAAGLDPKHDFKNADLSNLPLFNADLSGFNFTNSDLRNTGVRFCSAAKGTVFHGCDLDDDDREWVTKNFPPEGFSVRAVEQLLVRSEKIPVSWRRWVTKINLSDVPNIDSLDFVAIFPNLSELYVANTNIYDISAISKNRRLSILCINNTNVSDVSALRHMYSLRYLHLEGTKVVNLTSLIGLDNLQQIFLANTKIIDLTPLRGKTDLKISGVSVDNIYEGRELLEQ